MPERTWVSAVKLGATVGVASVAGGVLPALGAAGPPQAATARAAKRAADASVFMMLPPRPWRRGHLASGARPIGRLSPTAAAAGCRGPGRMHTEPAMRRVSIPRGLAVPLPKIVPQGAPGT